MKKPSDLIIPFSFEERRPIIIDRFFVIPPHYEKHSEWGLLNLTSSEVFSSASQVNIEFCSGNGQWILDKAQKSPYLNWVAVEFSFERARKIWAKSINMGLKNVFIVFGEAYCFAKNYLSDDTISNIFVNFPDPWPKKRHEKHRLVNSPFMKELSRIVMRGGIATLVTDDEAASEWMLEAAISSEIWKPLFKYPHYTNNLENYGGSYFDSLWRAKGKEIKYLRFANSK